MVCRTFGNLIVSAIATASLFAQSEGTLTSAFVGNKVTLKVDMPATSRGIDVFPGKSPPVNSSRVSRRLLRFGTAIKAGHVSTITAIRDTGHAIEVQLDGGGIREAPSDPSCVVPELVTRQHDLEEQRLLTKDRQQLSSVDLELRKLRLQIEGSQADCTRHASEIRTHSGSTIRVHYGQKVKRNELTPESLRLMVADYLEVPSAAAQAH